MDGMNNFWISKKVLVTGASGFIGSHLVRRLKHEGATVYVLLREKSIADQALQENEGSLGEACFGDVRDYALVHSIVVGKQVDTIFHLAAQPIVSNAFDSPLPTFDINIGGTIHVLEAARCSPRVKRVVVASTTHVYGDNPNLPYLESFFPRPSRPYETSKACADILTQTYFSTYGLPVAIARCTNTFGPGDRNYSRIVPKVARAIASGKNPEIIGGTSLRDYIYVSDVVDAYLTLAEQLESGSVRGQAFNFGSGMVISAIDMAKRLIAVSGKQNVELIVHPSEHTKNKNEIDKQYVSVDKAKAVLGWRATSDFDEALGETLAWYMHESVHSNLSKV